MIRLLFALVITFPLPLGAQPSVPVRFGPEFTFMPPSMLTGTEATEDASNKIIKRMNSHLVRGQPNGAKFSVEIDKFTSPNGWWAKVSTDLGVVEVNMSPLYVGQWEKYKSDIQDAVFVSAYNENAFPADYLGGGHINVELEPLAKRPLLLRNFIVDYWNNNQLSMGMFGYDTHNAISLWLMNDSSQSRVRALIEAFDSAYLNNVMDEESAYEWLDRLYRTLYTVHDPFLPLWEGGETRFKRHEISFLHASKNRSGRIELRAVRPQSNAQVWTNQIRLIQKRINYLSLKRKLIPLKARVFVPKLQTNQQIGETKLTPPIDPFEALKAFYSYVRESGERWHDHRDYIWPEWRKENGELQKFESSEWFQHRESTCKEYL